MVESRDKASVFGKLLDILKVLAAVEGVMSN